MNVDALVSALAGLGGVLTGSGFLVLVFRDKLSKVDKLTTDLTDLKDQRVAAIEARMKAFEVSCSVKHDRLEETLKRVEHMASDLNNLVGWTKKLDGKLDLLGQDAAAARATVEGQKVWLANLDRAHSEHVRDREAHHGRV